MFSKMLYKMSLLALFIGLCQTSILGAATLSNGVEPAIHKNFTLSYYSSQKVDHKMTRDLAKLDVEIASVFTKAEKFGIEITQPVHIRLWEDASFPCRDVWLSHEVDPTDDELHKLEESIEMSFAAVSYDELVELQKPIKSQYPFLSTLLGPMVTDQGDLDFLKGRYLISDLERLKVIFKELRESLNQPLADNQRFYSKLGAGCYNPSRLSITIAVEDRKKNLHRNWATVTHEVGHHIFAMLCDQIISDQAKDLPSTIKFRSWITTSIVPINELFADFSAVSNGNNMSLSIHGYGNLPDEFKRTFSRKRTLKSFMDGADNAGENGKYYLEAHNSLNPSRSFIWDLKLSLGTVAADKLVFASVRSFLISFFTKDVNEYERENCEFLGKGLFVLTNYPEDILSVNLSFLKFMKGAAQEQLSSEQLAKFNVAARAIYGSYFAE